MKEVKQLGRDSLCRYPDQTGPYRTRVKSISVRMHREIDDRQLKARKNFQKESLKIKSTLNGIKKKKYIYIYIHLYIVKVAEKLKKTSSQE